MFARMNLFSNDPFQVMLDDPYRQTRLDLEESSYVDSVGDSSDDSSVYPEVYGFDYSQPIEYHGGVMRALVLRVRLPEGVEHEFTSQYGDVMIPYLEEDLEKIMDVGHSYDDAVKILERVRGKKYGFAGDILDIIGKRKGAALERRIEKSAALQDALSDLDTGSVKRTEMRDVAKKFDVPAGINTFKYAAVISELIDTHGYDSVDHFDAQSVDWSEDVSELRRKAKKFGPRFTDVKDDESGSFSKCSYFEVCS